MKYDPFPDPVPFHQWPPGGWIFLQPQTGWKNPKPHESNFDQTVAKIIEHRSVNMLHVKHGLSIDHEAVSMELLLFTRKRLGKSIDESKKKKPITNLHPGQLAARLVGAAMHVSAGAEIIRDWLGSGGEPVGVSLANLRADICVGCPRHERAGFFDKITGAAAEAIKRQMGLKEEAGFVVDEEHELDTCGVCGCHLKLKVWVPLQHILKHTSPEDFAEFPDHCWIKTGQ